MDVMHGSDLSIGVLLTAQMVAQALTGDWFSSLTGAFGTTAFGVAALLIIWRFIVGPELAANRSMIDEMRKASENYRAASENYRVTVNALDRMSERVEHKLEVLGLITDRLTVLDRQTSEIIRKQTIAAEQQGG